MSEANEQPSTTELRATDIGADFAGMDGVEWQEVANNTGTPELTNPEENIIGNDFAGMDGDEWREVPKNDNTPEPPRSVDISQLSFDEQLSKEEFKAAKEKFESKAEEVKKAVGIIEQIKQKISKDSSPSGVIQNGDVEEIERIIPEIELFILEIRQFYNPGGDLFRAHGNNIVTMGESREIYSFLSQIESQLIGFMSEAKATLNLVESNKIALVGKYENLLDQLELPPLSVESLGKSMESFRNIVSQLRSCAVRLDKLRTALFENKAKLTQSTLNELVSIQLDISSLRKDIKSSFERNPSVLEIIGKWRSGEAVPTPQVIIELAKLRKINKDLEKIVDGLADDPPQILEGLYQEPTDQHDELRRILGDPLSTTAQINQTFSEIYGHGLRLAEEESEDNEVQKIDILKKPRELLKKIRNRSKKSAFRKRIEYFSMEKVNERRTFNEFVEQFNEFSLVRDLIINDAAQFQRIIERKINNLPPLHEAHMPDLAAIATLAIKLGVLENVSVERVDSLLANNQGLERKQILDSQLDNFMQKTDGWMADQDKVEVLKSFLTGCELDRLFVEAAEDGELSDEADNVEADNVEEVVSTPEAPSDVADTDVVEGDASQDQEQGKLADGATQAEVVERMGYSPEEVKASRVENVDSEFMKLMTAAERIESAQEEKDVLLRLLAGDNWDEVGAYVVEYLNKFVLLETNHD